MPNMRLFWNCLILLALQGLIVLNIHAQTADSNNPLKILNVELVRRGEQMSVRLITSAAPVYEITENLESQTLVVKFKKALAGFSDGRMERLFNDRQLAGIRFMEIPGDDPESTGDIWAQFRLRQKDLSYAVSSLKNRTGIQIDFRPAFKVSPLPDPPIDAVFQLSNVDFDNKNKDFTRITFRFKKPARGLKKGAAPEDTQPPRMFLLENSQQTHVTVRIPNTLPIKELEKLEFSGNRLVLEGMNTEINQTFIELAINAKNVKIEKHFVSEPVKWVLDIYGDSYKKEVDEVPEGEELSPEELAQQQKDASDRRRRGNAIQNLYQLGENSFSKGIYEEAVPRFQETYALGKMNSGDEFKDPMHPLAARSLFRIGDSLYTLIDRRKGNNFHKAIDAYKTAIRITQDAQVVAEKKGEKYETASLLPHANFRIGRAFQKMKFQHEAGVYYSTLQNKFPNSIEAMEASFWKGMSKIEQRQWETGISDFKEYLLTSPSPKYYSIAHYKMAQAYYQLGRYITAREFFDIARNSDPDYVKEEPSLLFHMGETYYENADYITAREIFKLLLNRYPNADFSKLIALRLGDFLRDEGKEDEAIEAYKNAISSYSREIALLGKLRIANIQAKRPYSEEYKEAIKVYREIPKLYPDTPQAEEALLREGLTLTLYGSYTAAIKALEEYMDKYPQSVYVKRNVIQENIDENLKGLLDQHFRAEDSLALVGAYRDYKSKYLLNFRYDTTLFQTAVAHRELGLYDDALDILRFLETRSTGTIRELIQFEKAKSFLEMGELNEARNTIARFIQDHPNSLYDAEARQLLARAYRNAKSYPKALLVYEQTIQKYDNDKTPIKSEIVPELYYDLGELLEETGNYAEAGEAYQQAIARYHHPVDHPDTPQYIIKSHFLAADMHNKVQNNKIALAEYQKAIALYGGNKDPDIVERIYWARYQIGTLHSRLGDDQKALKIFKELIDLKDGEGQLWKKLSAENHRAISRKLSYQNYMNE